MTTLNLSGKYTQNKGQSDDTDEILRLQGVGWLTRRAIQMATLYVTITHATEGGVEKITVDQVLSGGVGSSSETRVLDWQERDVDDKLFGAVVTRTERSKPEGLDNDWLKADWPETVREQGVIHTSGHSDTAKSGATWSAEMTWGLQDIDGERKYTRHVYFIGPGGEEIKARLVYDYTGPL
ncbi:hypothetical protein PHLGIDRAFT_17572 [Phlebiopsis gigantea 11061_1 CR5-6]|uniref:LCCL domain-containing protein n=1 Tax=Phlebiopsis gigantea (strain 11061_1 CR5-6) TaxID=745531 RepID=A0A0C3PWM5_PHLG1|nr:hypothetical protein PHLGIDRAFT_17572 [Phlebiopsis gigantea 11061_1 CR5-6]